MQSPDLHVRTRDPYNSTLSGTTIHGRAFVLVSFRGLIDLRAFTEPTISGILKH